MLNFRDCTLVKLEKTFGLEPYFCFQEYKKEKDPEGDPAAQALAAMLTAQALNQRRHPIYGCYIKGCDWRFMVLQDKQYAISQTYVATRDDLFDIFRFLKALKQMIAVLVEEDAVFQATASPEPL